MLRARNVVKKILITKAELTVREGTRRVELKCSNPGCVVYDKPILYNESAVNIRGTTAGV
jgi:hypothetical protein